MYWIHYVSMVRQQRRRDPKSETRRRILAAAAAVFAEQGFAKTSVEDIVARAGYTRGAFYSNFADKDAAFFALMDDRLEARSRAVAKVFAESSPLTLLDELRRWSDETRDDDPGARVRLFTEFRAHALTNERAREQLAAREREVREAYAAAIAAAFDAVGVPPPAPVDDLATIVHVLDTFVPLQHEIDPDAVRDGLFYDALALLFRSGVALSQQVEPRRQRRTRSA